MKKATFTFNETELIALKEACTEYYQNISKKVLSKGEENISPAAYNMHKTIEHLKKDFSNCIK